MLRYVFTEVRAHNNLPRNNPTSTQRVNNLPRLGFVCKVIARRPERGRQFVCCNPAGLSHAVITVRQPRLSMACKPRCPTNSLMIDFWISNYTDSQFEITCTRLTRLKHAKCNIFAPEMNKPVSPYCNQTLNMPGWHRGRPARQQI